MPVMPPAGGDPTAGDTRPGELQAESSERRSRATSRSEARREQNRISSQTYRRRRRHRLTLLNQLLGVDAPDTTTGHAISGQAAPLVGLENTCSPVGAASLHSPLATTWASETAIAPASGAPFDSLSDPLNQLNQQLPLYQEVPEIPSTSSIIDMGWMDPDLDPEWLNPVAMPREEETHPAGTTNSLSNLSKALGSLSSLSLLEKRQVLNLLESDVASQTVSTTTPSPPPPLHHPSSHLATTHTSPALYESKSIRFQVWLANRAIAPLVSPARRLTATLHLSQYNFWDALIANASAIRLAHTQISRQDGVSPFSRPQTASSSTDGGNSSVVDDENQALVPRDLHPTTAQLKHPHHPYLDLIPFASFRQRAIDAISSNPPLVNWKQLCADINAAGIVCWGGSEAGGGQNGGETVHMAFQMPWDARSWEPRVWFLKKYWFLVGGWDDEMWSSARWWASVRNETISPG